MCIDIVWEKILRKNIFETLHYILIISQSHPTWKLESFDPRICFILCLVEEKSREYKKLTLEGRQVIRRPTWANFRSYQIHTANKCETFKINAYNFPYNAKCSLTTTEFSRINELFWRRNSYVTFANERDHFRNKRVTYANEKVNFWNKWQFVANKWNT